MKKYLLIKILAIGVIILFAGASVVSSINDGLDNREIEPIKITDKIENINLGKEIFNPTDDAFVSEAVGHGGNNYGDEPEVHVSNKYGATPNWERNIFIRFDLSSLPSRANIISAKLYLYYYVYMDSNPVGRPLTIHRVLDDWDEDAITYNTQPPVTSVICSSANVPSSINIWMSWDLTNEVKDFVEGEETNYGWKIMDETYWGWYNLPVPYFKSKEYDNTPFSFNRYTLGEEILVSDSYRGILTTNFALGLFDAELWE